jgi:hypothetical protein
LAVCVAGCDVGAQTNELYARGAAVHLVASNIGTNTPLQVGQPIELAFDRLLLPITVTRQTFELSDSANPPNFVTFSIAYDPFARVVTLTPSMPAQLSVGTTYKLSILSESDPTNTAGLHAIDGATMDPNVKLYPRTITFQVVAASGTPPATCNGIVGPCIDFCSEIKPIFQDSCVAGTCHLGRTTRVPLGLVLSAIPCTAEAVQATAINRLSVEATMGALSTVGPPSYNFPQDMPIIDSRTATDPMTSEGVGPGGSGDPGNSYMIYKLLMASPPAMAQALTVYPLLTWPGGQPGVVPDLSVGERQTLQSLIPGREMPLGGQVTDVVNTGLSMDNIEQLSLWIAQGAPLSDCTTPPLVCPALP